MHTLEPGVEAADYGLVPVHCDVWAGFVFVNFDARPRQTLREFFGPMVTARWTATPSTG